MASGTLSGLRFSLLGPGRVGSSLAHWAVACGATLVATAGRSTPRAAALAAHLGGVVCAPAELSSGREELLLVAVPDSALDPAAELLAARPQARVVLHTCGSRGASALSPLGQAGSEPGSLHPLHAFPAALAVPPSPLSIAIDGTPEALATASALASAWGAEAIVVPEAARAIYHLAAVLSAGGVITLLALATELAARAGLPAAIARGYAALAQGALASAAASADPGDALTGPWERGDTATVEAHFAALSHVAPERIDLVAQLAREGLRQRERHHADARSVQGLRAALAQRGVP